jgi:hypothetical protein
MIYIYIHQLHVNNHKMMHRTTSGKLIEINKMDFKHDQGCFNKIYSLKQSELSFLLNVPNGASSFVKQIAPKSKSLDQQFMPSTYNH